VREAADAGSSVNDAPDEEEDTNETLGTGADAFTVKSKEAFALFPYVSNADTFNE